MTGLKISPRFVRASLGVALVWVACGLAAWLWLEPQPELVAARQSTLSASAQALEALAKPIVAVDLAALERVKLWGMERNGQAIAPPVAAGQIKKVLWTVTARVVRPNERYLLLYEPEAKLVRQVREGELLPDGSKLIKLDLNSFTVRLPNGKRQTTEINS